ncbi:hypothetical protein DFQ27_002956 [Actinomortierella ambigua]|uniref:MYND-type domain-containing protein n=1 Tax=Actinomortierella ambigua TaxID=1343610 RepID=A0A9P6Q621_9FUNG|nr:hypothetical protein DFQ27_002956 [Actinomortierella ambigua]
MELGVMEASRADDGPHSTKAPSNTIKMAKVLKDQFNRIYQASTVDIQVRLKTYGLRIAPGTIYFYDLRHLHGRWHVSVMVANVEQWLQPVSVIWILFSGQQWSHCIQTLGFAITEFEDIRPRMLELRASCHMALRNYKSCTEDLEEVLNISPSSIETHSMLGNVYYATHDATASLSHFKAFVASAHVDSRTLPNAYYALSTLTLQSAPSGATKKKSNQALKQAAVFKEAQDYYAKALEADQRFKELYSVVTAFNDIKRTAVLAFQARNPATSGRTLLPNLQQTNALEDAATALRKTFKTPGLASCANCGRPDNVANEGRSEELKPKPLIKCTKCNKVAYCSRPCQIKHWNASHKDTCKK